MIKPETHELIEQYLLGKLSSTDLQAFEQRLASEPDFAAEVALQKQVFEALRIEANLASFRAQLAAVEKKIEAETVAPVQPHRPVRRWMAIGLGLVLMAILGWWVWRKATEKTPTTLRALYAAHFSPPESISSAARRGEDTTTAIPHAEADQQWNALWDSMEMQYSQKDFAGALATLQQIQALDPSEEYASETFFYAGLLQLHLGKAAPALEDFQKVTQGHSEDKTWYSALALLALDRRNEAKALFEEIVAKGYPQKNQARQILDSL